MDPLFCPNCKSLLTIRRNKGNDVKLCRNCGHESRSVVQGSKPHARKAVNPDFPLFFYDRIRGGQREFMEDVRKVAVEGKVLLAHAPTGIGKTVATLSILLEVALASDKVIFFLTSKQSQHTIVIDTLRDIAELSGRHIKAVDVIAKQAMCPDAHPRMPGYAFTEFCKNRTRSHSCSYHEKPMKGSRNLVFSKIMHVHELKRVCIRADVCPHKAAQDAIGVANIVICDYNYIFDGIAEPILERAGKGLGDLLLVVDEAHNLPDRIRSNMSIELTSYDIAEAVRELGGKGLRGPRYTKVLKNALDGWMKKISEHGEQYFEKQRLEMELENAFSEVLGEKDTLATYIKWLRDIGEHVIQSGAERSYVLQLGDFLDKWVSLKQGVARIFSRGAGVSWKLKIAFLTVETTTGPVFSEVGAAVLMSGTLCPPGMYADILGVPEKRCMEKIYESPFPKENRRVLGVGGITTLYKRRDDGMYENFATHLVALAGAVDGNVAAFFPSYKFMGAVDAKIKDILSGKELLVESKSMTKRDREHLIERLHDRNRTCLMLAVQGGSLSEGIDYEGNILSAVAVIGLPLAPPNLEIKALIRHFASKFGEEKGNFYGYIAPAFNKVVQSAGRLIRSEKDRGVIILMDERFSQARYATVLPPEMGSKMLNSLEELIAEVELFFDTNKSQIS